MQHLHLKGRQCLTDEEANALGGLQLDNDSYDTLVSEACTVYKPDGEVLLVYLPDVLSQVACNAAYHNLRSAVKETDNRGMAGGVVHRDKVKTGDYIGSRTRTRYRRVNSRGELERVQRANIVKSGIVGNFDRSTRFPYCRQTAFNLEHGHRFQQALPFIRETNAIFKAGHPKRYAAQEAVIAQTSPDFYISGTVFTTVTVNLNWQTAVHKDRGDYAEGFGVMTALCAGAFDGAYLCFPQYRIAVNVRTRGVLLSDVHEWHGNTPFDGIPGTYERLSFVLYYRERMSECGTAVEELARVKARQLGDKLYD